MIVLGTNPGRIRAELANHLERPRDRRSEDFGKLVDEIYGIMTDRPSAVAAVAEDQEGGGVEHVRLPHASVDGIAGLAELALASGDNAELASLAAVVGFEIDDLFPIVDALRLLGFATVENGRLNLTEAGERFAGADIQRSKEIFREAALRRVPLVRRIHRALEHSSDGALREGFFIDLLASDYSRDEARAQLDTAIDWGRYAELFEYEAGHGEIKLHVQTEQPATR
ncbi:MAG: AAA-associated domain-containing protein [Solirubrobacteraceae bacterium]